MVIHESIGRTPAWCAVSVRWIPVSELLGIYFNKNIIEVIFKISFYLICIYKWFVLFLCGFCVFCLWVFVCLFLFLCFLNTFSVLDIARYLLMYHSNDNIYHRHREYYTSTCWRWFILQWVVSKTYLTSERRNLNKKHYLVVVERNCVMMHQYTVLWMNTASDVSTKSLMQ